jgi:hypothetical protein
MPPSCTRIRAHSLQGAVGDRVQRRLLGGLGEDRQKPVGQVVRKIFQIVHELCQHAEAKDTFALRGGQRTGHEVAIGQHRGAALLEADPEHVDLPRRWIAAQLLQAFALRPVDRQEALEDLWVARVRIPVLHFAQRLTRGDPPSIAPILRSALSLHCQVNYGYTMRSLPATGSGATLLNWNKRHMFALGAVLIRRGSAGGCIV